MSGQCSCRPTLEVAEDFPRRRVADYANDNVKMVDHDRHGQDGPTTEACCLEELRQRDASMGGLQQDRWTFQQRLRCPPEPGHGLIVWSIELRMGDARGIFD